VLKQPHRTSVCRRPSTFFLQGIQIGESQAAGAARVCSAPKSEGLRTSHRHASAASPCGRGRQFLEEANEHVRELAKHPSSRTPGYRHHPSSGATVGSAASHPCPWALTREIHSQHSSDMAIWTNMPADNCMNSTTLHPGGCGLAVRCRRVFILFEVDAWAAAQKRGQGGSRLRRAPPDVENVGRAAGKGRRLG
jgi:hypothetical protein